MSLSVTSKQIFKLKMCSVFTCGSGKCLSFYCVPRHCSWREKCDSNSLHTLSILWENRNERKIKYARHCQKAWLWVARGSCLRNQHRHLLRIARLTAASRRSQWAGSLPVDTKIRGAHCGQNGTQGLQHWKEVTCTLSTAKPVGHISRGNMFKCYSRGNDTFGGFWEGVLLWIVPAGLQRDLTLGGEGREDSGEQPRGPPRPWLFTNSFTLLWLQLLSISLFEFW